MVSIRKWKSVNQLTNMSYQPYNIWNAWGIVRRYMKAVLGKRKHNIQGGGGGGKGGGGGGGGGGEREGE